MSLRRRHRATAGTVLALLVMCGGRVQAAASTAPSESEPSVEPKPSAKPSAASLAAPLYLLDRLAAGASLGYFTANRARILSEVHFDFPFIVAWQKSLYVRGSLETSTVKTGQSFRADSFQAQDIDYLFEAGARDYLNNRVAIAAFLGQQGRKQLDQSGSASIKYIGLGFESAGFPRPGGRERFEWRLAAGPTIRTENVQADAVLRGAVLYDVWRGARARVGIDGSFDSLFDRFHGRTEYRIGPRLTLPLPNGIRASLFAEWIRGRNPLLLAGSQGWNFGFKYNEGSYSGPHTLPLPDVRGILSVARGGSRSLIRFDLDLASSSIRILSRPGALYANLDANLVGGTSVDNFYYIATAGVFAEFVSRILLGPQIYHRSNHTFGQGSGTASPGSSGLGPERSTSATSLNVIQIVGRSAGWDYANRLPGRLIPESSSSGKGLPPGSADQTSDPGGGPDTAGSRWRWLDRLEASIAPGVVTNSNFSTARSWDLQAGARFDLLARTRRLVPFVRAFSEWGDVTRREASVGFSTRQNIVVELRYRRDSQDFGEDQRDVFLGASLYF